MIEYVKLTNFQRHESLEIDFERGLTGLIGANEAGKSSVIRAVLYALGGSRLLPRSLEGTVTYGKPVSSLKVELAFRVFGERYVITRSKSGAEMISDGNLSTGQAEVTAAVERLLGVPVARLAQIVVANQTSLRGVVSEGAEAVKLIEQLANLDLVEELIQKIDAQLPCGNTKSLTAQAEKLAAIEQPVQEDFSEQITTAKRQLDDAERLLADAKSQAALCDKQLAEALAAKTKFDDVERQRQRLLRTIQMPRTEPVAYKPLDVDAIQKARALQLQDEETRNAWAEFQALNPIADPGQRPVSDAALRIGNLKAELATARARRINETSCALCGKLLQDVPEVVQGNAVVDAKVSELTEALAHAEAEHGEHLAAVKRWDRWKSMYDSFLNRASRLHKWVKQSGDQCVWIGPEVASEPDTTDYAAMLRKDAEMQRKVAAAQGQIAAEEAAIAAAQRELENLLKLADVPDLGELRKAASTAQELVNAYKDSRDGLADELAALVSQQAAAQASFAARLESFAAARSQHAELIADIREMEANNALVKKLRTARPALAAKLWAGLLGAISTLFSRLRGQPSVVTRTSDGFEVDGKPVTDLSGSTLDILGLAVRVSLQRAFLPGVNWLVLDEPSAACDAERETEMLALLATLGLDQVLLVSHSESAKAVVDNLVEI